jgi:hypothetical protein
MLQRMKYFVLPMVAAAALAIPAAAGPKAPKATPAGPVVVELFTSQACGACPEANALIGELAQKPGVIALTFPVDYWDYLGWKDTLAQPAFSARQKAYAAQDRRRGVSTPQVVVNGERKTSAVKTKRVHEVIAATKGAGAVPVSVDARNGKARVYLAAGRAPAKAKEVWLASFDPGPVFVTVEAGENAGKRVAHYNVVRSLTRLGSWTGAAAEYAAACAPACAVLVHGADGRITAARVASTADLTARASR